MKSAKALLIGSCSVVMAGFILTLLAPRTVHALAATAVQVVNTPSAPVMSRDVDNPAKDPFASSCYASGQGSPVLTPSCTIAVPAGKRLVVENVSIEAGFTAGGLSFAAIEFVTNGAGGRHAIVTSSAGAAFGGVSYSVANTPVRLYADSGTNLNVLFFGTYTSVNFGPSVVHVTGYLVTP